MRKGNIAEGRAKQVRGKANDIAGAVTGNTGRQLKGKLQKVVGKVQAAVGRAERPRRSALVTTRTTTTRRTRI